MKPKTTAAALLALNLALAAPAQAAPLSPQARAEVEALLAQLQSSSCDFNRNGSWHMPAEARAHLLRKLAYFEEKSMVGTADQFIELAATRSSSSGKPYLVRCPGSATVPSGDWLKARLAVLRKTS